MGSGRHLGPAAIAIGLFGGTTSCLPSDTRPVPGSLLLLVTSDDQTRVTTADGWSITVDRLLLGIGDARLDSDCRSYSEGSYQRLLDGVRPGDQKLSITYGLGRCAFSFDMWWPNSDTVLGEGVSEEDRTSMKGWEGGPPGEHVEGIAVDFGATATRGKETKRMRWRFPQASHYRSCSRGLSNATSQPIDLESDANVTLHIVVRTAALFADDFDPTTADLRFDAMADADTIRGNGDGEVTLEELGNVSLDVARQAGPSPYSVENGLRDVPHSLEGYLYLVLLRRLIGFREDIACAYVL